MPVGEAELRYFQELSAPLAQHPTTIALGSTVPLRPNPTPRITGGELFSWFGNGVTLAAVPIYVLTRTGSSVAAGTAGAANALPLVISGLAGGVLVDRWPCRRSGILADLFAGLFTAAVPVLGHLSSSAACDRGIALSP
jgi:MFS family permease